MFLKSKANIILSGKRLNAFPRRLLTRQECLSHHCCSTLYQDSEVNSRWQCRKTLNSPLPQTWQIYSYIWNNFPLKRTWDLDKQGPYNKWIKGHIRKGRRGRDSVLPGTQPQARCPIIWKGSPKYQTFPQEVIGLCPTSGTSIFGSSTEKTNPQNVWFWKSTGSKSRGNIEIQRMKNLLLKGSHEDPLSLKSSMKATVWKVPK